MVSSPIFIVDFAILALTVSMWFWILFFLHQGCYDLRGDYKVANCSFKSMLSWKTFQSWGGMMKRALMMETRWCEVNWDIDASFTGSSWILGSTKDKVISTEASLENRNFSWSFLAFPVMCSSWFSLCVCVSLSLCLCFCLSLFVSLSFSLCLSLFLLHFGQITIEVFIKSVKLVFDGFLCLAVSPEWCHHQFWLHLGCLLVCLIWDGGSPALIEFSASLLSSRIIPPGEQVLFRIQDHEAVVVTFWTFYFFTKK